MAGRSPSGTWLWWSASSNSGEGATVQVQRGLLALLLLFILQHTESADLGTEHSTENGQFLSVFVLPLVCGCLVTVIVLLPPNKVNT